MLNRVSGAKKVTLLEEGNCEITENKGLESSYIDFV
jgi:hypothetical protein